MPIDERIPDHVAAVRRLWYGHGYVPSKSDLEFCWKAVKAVAAGDGLLSEPERLHLLGRMCSILTPPDVIEEVMRYDERSESAQGLLARIRVPDEMRPGTGVWIVYEGVSVAISDGELAAAELNSVRRFAAAMGVRAKTADALTALCREEAAMRTRRIELLGATLPVSSRFAHETAEHVTRDQPMQARP
jgi:hypothetical protein